MSCIRYAMRMPSEGEMCEHITPRRSFPFLSLPIEIRRIIYSFVFRCVDPVFLPILRNSGYAPWLLFVCRQIYHEGAPVFYGQNVFHFKNLTSTQPYLLGNGSLQMVKHILVHTRWFNGQPSPFEQTRRPYLSQIQTVRVGGMVGSLGRNMILEFLCELIGSSDFPSLVRGTVTERHGLFSEYRALSTSENLEEGVSRQQNAQLVAMAC